MSKRASGIPDGSGWADRKPPSHGTWYTPGGASPPPMIRVLSREIGIGFVVLSIIHTFQYGAGPGGVICRLLDERSLVDQSDSGSAGMYSRRTNLIQEARIYSHNGPIRFRKEDCYGWAVRAQGFRLEPFEWVFGL
eukprot:7056996-Pyramimonas_sp.AAC.1